MLGWIFHENRCPIVKNMSGQYNNTTDFNASEKFGSSKFLRGTPRHGQSARRSPPIGPRVMPPFAHPRRARVGVSQGGVVTPRAWASGARQSTRVHLGDDEHGLCSWVSECKVVKPTVAASPTSQRRGRNRKRPLMVPRLGGCHVDSIRPLTVSPFTTCNDTNPSRLALSIKGTGCILSNNLFRRFREFPFLPPRFLDAAVLSQVPLDR